MVLMGYQYIMEQLKPHLLHKVALLHVVIYHVLEREVLQLEQEQALMRLLRKQVQ